MLIPPYLPPPLPGVAAIGISVIEVVVRCNLAEGRRPYVEYVGPHYTNPVLAQSAWLKDVAMDAHVDNNDLRSFELFFKSGEREVASFV